MSTTEVLWGLGGAIVGWIIGNARALAEDIGRRYLLKRAVVSELDELRTSAETTWRNLSRTLGLAALGGTDDFASLPLGSPLFDAHYPDAMLVFTARQRLAIQQVHGTVVEVNSLLADVYRRAADMADAVARGDSVEVPMGRYKTKVRALMTTIAQAHWLAGFYLRTSGKTALRDNKQETQHYEAFMRSMSSDLDQIERSAVALGREQAAFLPLRSMLIPTYPV